MKRTEAALALASTLASLGSCHKTPAESPDAGADAAAAEAQAPEASALAPARCTTSHEGFAAGDPSAPTDVEIGDAVSFPGDTAVGLVRRTPAGRLASVAVIDAALGGVRVVDLGATLGDAPPPGVGWADAQLVATAYALPPVDAGAGARSLTVYAVDPVAGATVLGSVPQHRDDSLAFDVAWSGGTGLVVWDEAVAGDSGVPRGVIRAATLTSKARPPGGATTDVSPPESDAELPRVVSTERGFDVLWIARAPEPAQGETVADSSATAEVTGEPRTYSFIERIALDKQGKALGPAKRLSPANGHVSSFDVLAATDAGKPSLLVVGRDEGEAVDGSGGALLRVRLVGDAPDPTLAYATDGLGRGAPELVPTPRGPWLSWVGPHEQLRLLPLDPAGVPLGAPSHEDALDEARLLAPAAGGARLLAATPTDATSQLRAVVCVR